MKREDPLTYGTDGWLGGLVHSQKNTVIKLVGYNKIYCSKDNIFDPIPLILILSC